MLRWKKGAGTLSEEDLQRVLAGGPIYIVKEPELVFYKGAVRNRPLNIRLLLEEAGIAP